MVSSGFNFIRNLLEKGTKCNISCIDSMTYAAEPFINEKIKFLEDNKVHIYKYAIFDPKVSVALSLENTDTIVNFAAETHVDNTIASPGPFITSNIVGVFNLLEFAALLKLRFHQIGTDEVYGPTTPEMGINENSQLVPSSPYSATKASADMLVLSYARTFGVNATISRCTNNFGPWQHEEKLLPKTICNALKGKKIPVYGDGMQRRHWIYVDDHNDAVMKILQHGKPGEIYNIAPPKENLITNIDLIKMVLAKLGKSEDLIKFVKDRPGHDGCYFLYGDKIKEECGYDSSSRDFKKDLDYTIDWYSSKLSKRKKKSPLPELKPEE